MNWPAVNAVAQIVAAGGVIGTLIYLAVQIRQNTRSIRRAAFQELINHIAGINLLATQREIAEVMIGARAGLDALDEADQLRLLTWMNAVLRHYHNAYEQYRAGMITADQWEAIALPMGRLLSDRGGSEAWAIMAAAFPPQFRTMVDDRLRRRREQAAGAPPDGAAGPR